MRDGTRLAVDVYRPNGRVSVRLPALLELTRYWRSSENPATGTPIPALRSLDRFFLAHDYAIVKVDVRGSGASFGSRDTEYGDEEVKDGYDVVEWVVNQPWSDGNVGAYGTSYTGTTAELLSAVGHPAVKAVIPGWSDLDVYVSPVRPYGLCASGFIQEWSAFVDRLDANETAQLGRSVRRVDADTDGSLLAAAVAEHAGNPDVFYGVQRAEYRDDAIDGTRIYEVGPLRWKKEIEKANVPALVLVSWFDAGSADGALQRFRRFSHPQKLVIMATNHGGVQHASPFASSTQPAPAVQEQYASRLAFFDHHLKAQANEVETWPAVRYYNLGEEAFRETEHWPPSGHQSQRWYLRENHNLSTEKPGHAERADTYRIDFTVSTGTTNRWTTQMGGPVRGLDDRAQIDSRMLTYTSDPLRADIQVTGSAVVTLHVASDHADGTFFVYLEDVDADGRSRYITEGGLRAVHRKPWRDPLLGADGPLHSFRRDDKLPLVPGEVAALRFRFWPTSVLFRAGHRIRIAIAGADADTFDRVPARGTPTITVWRSASQASFVELPVIE
jgi:putative CocE/NonD family hydrolase